MTNRIIKRIIKELLGVSIFIKILGIPLSVVILLAAGTIITTGNILHSTLVKQLETEGKNNVESAARDIADFLAVHDEFGAYRSLSELMDSNDDVVYAFIQKDRVSIYSNLKENVSDELLASRRQGETDEILYFMTEKGKVYDISAPIMGGSFGMLRVGFSGLGIQKEIKKRMLQLSAMIGVISVLGFIISYMITNILYRPIMNLSSAVAEVGKGNFAVRISPKMGDEIGKLSESFNEMTKNLGRLRSDLKVKERVRQKLMERIITSQEDERTRISRDLHDKAGQILSSLKIGLKSFETGKESQKIRKKREKFMELLNASLEELHDLSIELRPPVLQDFGLFRAVKNYADNFTTNQGIKVACNKHFKGKMKIQPAAEVGMYRIMQEALTNVVKHAEADEVLIDFEKSGSRFTMRIKDNGKGFMIGGQQGKRARKSMGILGMQERAAIIGANMKLISRPGSGTVLSVTIREDR